MTSLKAKLLQNQDEAGQVVPSGIDNYVNDCQNQNGRYPTIDDFFSSELGTVCQNIPYDQRPLEVTTSINDSVSISSDSGYQQLDDDIKFNFEPFQIAAAKCDQNQNKNVINEENDEVIINTFGPHLHIPANVTLRADRRLQRASSCPPEGYNPQDYDSQQHTRQPVIYEKTTITPSEYEPSEEVPLQGTASLVSVASFAVRGTTKRQKLILVSLALVDFLSYMCLSILAPFFPKEAEHRHINNTLSGWIFGVFALVQFLTSPVFGKLLPAVGSRFMFISGVFLGGGCTIIFGALKYFPLEQELTYVVFCFILRVLIGLGCTASNTASFAIMADTFPDNVGSVFGILETFTGLGLMVGPALGGVLYQAGGFFLPFAVLGGIMCAGVPLCIIILPKQNDFETTVAQGAARGSYKDLLRMPIVIVVCASVTSAALVWSLLDPTLEPHFRVFQLSTAIVGLIFLLCSAFYAISAPLWGWITDTVRDGCILLTLGFLCSSAAFLFLGPSQLIGFSKDYNELWLNLAALIALGTSVSMASVPTFEKILDVAEQEGIEDGLMLYGTVAGIWGSANALGEFIGPSIGGTLVSMVGFGWTMTACSGLCLLMALLNFICWCYNSTCCKAKKVDSVLNSGYDEQSPLLPPQSTSDVTHNVPPSMSSSAQEHNYDSDIDESENDYRTRKEMESVLKNPCKRSYGATSGSRIWNHNTL